MLRKVVVTLFILAGFILQCTVFDKLAFAGIIPNLMIILTSSFGFMRGEKEGLVIGFLLRAFERYLFWKFSGILCAGSDVHRLSERKVQPDFLSGGYQASYCTDYYQRPFLRYSDVCVDVHASGKIPVRLLFHARNFTGSVVYHCSNHVFLSDYFKGERKTGGKGKEESAEICLMN